VDDALAEAGIGGELVVEVEAVRVAADRGANARTSASVSAFSNVTVSPTLM